MVLRSHLSHISFQFHSWDIIDWKVEANVVFLFFVLFLSKLRLCRDWLSTNIIEKQKDQTKQAQQTPGSQCGKKYCSTTLIFSAGKKRVHLLEDIKAMFCDIYCVASTCLNSMVGKVPNLLCESNKIPHFSETGGDRYGIFLEKLNLKLGQVYTPNINFGPTYWRVYDQICCEKVA